jgi:hypothetical protein
MGKKITPFSINLVFFLFLFSYSASAQLITSPAKMSPGNHTFTVPFLNYYDPCTTLASGGDASCVSSGGSTFTTDYLDNLDITETLLNTTGGCFTGSFNFGSVGLCSGDVLYVFDGPSTASAQVAGSPWTNTFFPSVTSFTTTSPYVTIKFTSDASLHAKGWVINFASATCPTIPPNNDYSSATSLSGLSCSSPTSGTTYFSTTTTGVPAPCIGSGAYDVWYSFVANVSSPTITVVGGAAFRPAAQLYDGYPSTPTSPGGSIGGTTCSSTGTGGGSITLSPTGLTVGTTYYIRVFDLTGAVPTTGFTFTICVTQAPQQDCAGAATVNSFFTLTGTAVGVGVQEYSAATFGCLVSGEHNSLWFKMKVTSPGTIAFTLTPANSGAQDIDWAIWGPYASSSCSNITGSPLRCTYAVSHPTNGLGSPTYVPAWGGLSNDNTEGAGGNGWLSYIPCTSGCAFTDPFSTITVGQWFIFLIDGFGSFAGGSFSLSWTGTATLPIVLTDFYGESYLDFNKLYWMTASEMENDYWTIERSADGMSFETIAKMDGAGTSTTSKSYQYFDHSPLKGNNYYRLKQTDNDGSFNYSNVVMLKNYGEQVAIENIYPNPTTGLINVSMYSNEGYDCSLMVSDQLGKVVLNEVYPITEGSNLLTIDLQKFEHGIYYLRFQDPHSGQIITRKIVKM